jgi:hypothetical protein
MTRATHGGKGSQARPTDMEKYYDSYEAIFNSIKEEVHTPYDEETPDDWEPACGGTEHPFDWGGKTYLYMYNKTTGEHAYYNLTEDIFEQNVEFS